ncbi:MAG: PhoH family protein, partial [Prevotella sp.]|nr:PhoH family protein [Prevotella sp.]
GWNTKMVITGDLTQVDLPHGQRSGLAEAMELLEGLEGIGFVRMEKKDIVRHKLVTRIVNAYERADKSSAKERQEGQDRHDKKETL